MAKVIYHINDEWDYLRIPKCGCTSVLAAIAKMRGMEPNDDLGYIHEQCAPHIPQGRRPDRKLLVVVRDPIDRMISFYKDKIIGERTTWTDAHPMMQADGLRRQMSWHSFLEAVAKKTLPLCNDHLQPQWTFTEGFENITYVKLEHLASLSLIGLPIPQRLNATPPDATFTAYHRSGVTCFFGSEISTDFYHHATAL